MRIVFTLTIGLFIILSSCKKHEIPKSYVVRVGNSILTKEEIQKYFNKILDTSDYQFKSFLQNWIETDLFYQEALSKGFDKSESIKKQLLDVEKQLIIQAYLDQVIYGDSIEISEDEIRSYYNIHSNEFVLRDDLIRLNIATFNNRVSANEFRNNLLKGKSWSDSINTDLISIITNQLFTKLTLFPSELWKVAFSLSKDLISLPIKIGDSFYVIQLINKYPKGTVPELKIVQDEIKMRVIIEKRREKRKRLVEELNKKYQIEINTEVIKLND